MRVLWARFGRSVAVAVLIAVLGVALTTVHRELLASSPVVMSADATAGYVRGWEAQLDAGTLVGPAGAPVVGTIISTFEHQCCESLGIPGPAGEMTGNHSSGLEQNRSLRKIGDFSSPGIFRWSRGVWRDGHFFVAPLKGGGVQAFDSAGAILWTALQPEVSDNWNVGLQIVGDSLIVYDPVNGKAHVLSLGGAHLSERSIPENGSTYLLIDGSLYYTAHIPTPGQFGYPLHEVTEDGRVDSFGYGGEAFVPGVSDPYDLEWKLVKGSRGSVWTHRRNRFLLEEWSGRQATDRRIAREPEWLPARQVGGEQVMVSRLHEAFVGADTIWTVGHVLSPDWRDVLGEEWDGRAPTVEEEHRVFDSIVEGWTVEDGERVSRMIVNEMISGFASVRRVYSVTETPPSAPVLVLWEIMHHPEHPSPQ